MKNFERELAYQAIADEIFVDYKIASSLVNVEPENFVEKWLVKRINKIKKLEERAIWRYFLQHLLSYKKEVGD